MAKFFFGITIILLMGSDFFALFSKKYKKKILENKNQTEDISELIDPRIMMIIENIMTMFLIIALFFYFKHFVGFHLAFGYIILQLISLIIVNVYQYCNQILSDKGFFFLDKVISIAELFMLTVIGYVGFLM